MAKVRFFSFFYEDYQNGTRNFTLEEKGGYVDLLCEQAQLHPQAIPFKKIKRILGNMELWELIQEKFIEDEDGNYYNQKLYDEMEISLNKIQIKIDNLKGRGKKQEKDPKLPAKKEDPIDYQDMIEKWNKLAEHFNLSKLAKLSEGRKAKIKTRSKDKDFIFEQILRKIEKTPFLLGHNKNGWKVSFDWIFENDQNYLKIMEGKYDGKNQHSNSEDELREIAEEIYNDPRLK